MKGGRPPLKEQLNDAITSEKIDILDCFLPSGIAIFISIPILNNNFSTKEKLLLKVFTTHIFSHVIWRNVDPKLWAGVKQKIYKCQKTIILTFTPKNYA